MKKSQQIVALIGIVVAFAVIQRRATKPAQGPPKSVDDVSRVTSRATTFPQPAQIPGPPMMSGVVESPEVDNQDVSATYPIPTVLDPVEAPELPSLDSYQRPADQLREAIRWFEGLPKGNSPGPRGYGFEGASSLIVSECRGHVCRLSSSRSDWSNESANAYRLQAQADHLKRIREAALGGPVGAASQLDGVASLFAPVVTADLTPTRWKFTSRTDSGKVQEDLFVVSPSRR